jgi:S-adenosylmethionine-dependent methyltransferase
VDKNFDELADRFKNKVYSAGKGEIRQAVLQFDILQSFPEIENNRELKILDAGGGMGQISRWLAEKGHRIMLCDLSGEMLEIAKEENKLAGLESRIELVQAPIQKLPRMFKPETFDLILLHGVIEWMEKPLNAIQILYPLLKREGGMSLLYFNREKLILKWGINGQYKKAMEGKSEDLRPLTPTNPLSEHEVLPLLRKLGFKSLSKAGIRIFFDFFKNEAPKNPDIEKSIELEKNYCHIEPFASLGEHTHIACRR